MSLQRYPLYGDSRVEWLGEVPRHWDVCALNHRFEVALGKMLDEKRVSGNFLGHYLRNVDVQWGAVNTRELPTMDFSGSDLERYTLRGGDLLVCEGGELGRAALWKEQAGVHFYQKALHRLRARDTNRDSAHYLLFVLRAAVDTGIFQYSEGKSTIPHLTAEAFRRYRFPFPPLPEQIAIAGFLEKETSQIDALIEEQAGLSKLLQEKAQTLIWRAITKGTRNPCRRKPSGLTWIGDVPEDWDVLSLSRVTTSKCDGPFGTALKSDHYADDGVRVVRLQNIKANAFDNRDRAFVEQAYFDEFIAGHDVVSSDLLIAGLGDDRNTVGRACVAHLISRLPWSKRIAFGFV